MTTSWTCSPSTFKKNSSKYAKTSKINKLSSIIGILQPRLTICCRLCEKTQSAFISQATGSKMKKSCIRTIRKLGVTTSRREMCWFLRMKPAPLSSSSKPISKRWFRMWRSSSSLTKFCRMGSKVQRSRPIHLKKERLLGSCSLCSCHPATLRWLEGSF